VVMGTNPWKIEHEVSREARTDWPKSD